MDAYCHRQTIFHLFYVNLSYLESWDNHIRLKSSGHGQTGLKELDKYGIDYHIVKTYPNGVRVGYVPNYKASKKKNGVNQAWFSASWTSKGMVFLLQHLGFRRKLRIMLTIIILFG